MIALEPDELPSVEALGHYQIIRRNGAMVPFEPNKIAIAMAKVFSALKRIELVDSWAESWLQKIIQTHAERLTSWRYRVRLHACEFQRTTQIHRAKNLSVIVASACLVAGRYNGFFKSSKPNLQNAP